MATEIPVFKTTIDQHQGTHAGTGLPEYRLVEVRTEWPPLADEWDQLSEEDRQHAVETVADLHGAEVELAELPADVRATAKENLETVSGLDDYDCAATVIRRAVADANRGPHMGETTMSSTFRTMTTRLQWDTENNAEEWADAARARIAEFPAETHGLILGAEKVLVTPAVADRFMALAATLPGWADGPKYAREAILRYDD